VTKLKKPLDAVSIAALILSVVPYGLGLFNNLEPGQCGKWVAVMILGVLYSSLASAMLATLELADWHKKSTDRLSRLRSRPTQPRLTSC
jgi:hypothetical protein